MTATTESKVEAPEAEVVPLMRDCTRCRGIQTVVGSDFNLGYYECDECFMRVGFDLESPDGRLEFLLYPGEARLYTKNRFGLRLNGSEIRIAGNQST